MILSIGKHRVRHGDVMDGIDQLMNGEKADIFYSDPPWGQGNMKYWHTMNRKMNGVESELKGDLSDFLEQIFSIANKYAKGPIFIEYGCQWEENIRVMGNKYGFSHLGIADLRYKSGSKLLPLHLHVFSKGPLQLPQGYLKSLSGTFGFETLKRAVTPFAVKDGIVLDPCCGMGYSARAAIENGMSFRGNELNRKRLQKTIEKLQKDGGQ